LKLVLAPSSDTDPPASAISTWDNLTGINDTTVTVDQWISGQTPTYVGATQFTLVGDQTSTFHVGRRVKTSNSGGTVYGTITASAYTTLTTVTIVTDSGSLDAGLSAVYYGIVAATNTSLPGVEISGDDWTHQGKVTHEAAVWMKEGASVASASDCDIWAAGDGNTVHVTGTTTITDWGTAPQAGAWMRVIFDGALTLTYNATTNDIEGGASIVTAAGDSCIVYANSTSAYQVFNFTRSTNAEFTIASATTTDLGTSSSDNVYISGTTTITGLGTVAAGVRRKVRFADALTLTHNGTSLILPTAANITTATNDTADFLSLGSGNWICTDYATASGAPLAVRAGSGTVVATTSGTTADFTSIPSWVKKITCILSGVSWGATTDPIIQIGDSGGIETTGYLSTNQVVTGVAGATIIGTEHTDGFGLMDDIGTRTSAGEAMSGILTLALVDASTNTWIASGTFHSSDVSSTYVASMAAGSKSLSATLDRVRLTTTSASTFDAGKFNILYE